MKTKPLTSLILSVFLLYGCFAPNNSAPSTECITGKVAFTKDGDLNTIYVLDIKSSKQSILYNDPSATGIGGVSWSPDGQSISFSRYSGDNSDIYILALNNSIPRQIANTPNIELSPSWSPDGEFILTTSVTDKYGQLLKIKADGSNTNAITNENWGFSQASWSPDGEKIVFISDKDVSHGIYIMNSDGSDQLLLSKEVSGYMPQWSPDGNYISFNSRNLSVKNRVVLYNIQDQTFSLLIPGDVGNSNEKGYSLGSANWSKNGQCIMFIKGENANAFIYVMDFASRDMKELIDIGLINSLDWFSE